MSEQNRDSVESISDPNGQELAVIVRISFNDLGITFFTPPSAPQQLGFMRHRAGHRIQPHVHNPIRRTFDCPATEVLLIRRGVLIAEFYGMDRELVAIRHLTAGDAVLLVSGGHGFSVLEEVEMFEVKLGPWTGERDKTRFDPKE